MKLTPRQLDILFRHGLAERFTSPSTSMKPRLQFEEIKELETLGFLEGFIASGRPPRRLTAAAKAIPEIAKLLAEHDRNVGRRAVRP